MIVMMLDDGVVIGLTAKNMAHLMADRPGHVKLPRTVNVKSIMILRGDTKPDIIRQMEAAGIEIPQAVKAAALEDPS